MKRQGYTGWFADFKSEKSNKNGNPEWISPTNPLNWDREINANREFVEVSFPCATQVEKIRVQGVKKHKVGAFIEVEKDCGGGYGIGEDEGPSSRGGGCPSIEGGSCNQGDYEFAEDEASGSEE